LKKELILAEAPIGYLSKPRLDHKREKAEVYFDPQRADLVKRIFQEYAIDEVSIRNNIIQ